MGTVNNTVNILEEDLNHILAHTKTIWDEMRGKKIFITGGTGFFGVWLLESFHWINNALKLDASATVLTRDLNRFKNKAPHLVNCNSIDFVIGDIRNFEYPQGRFDFVIHAATEASVKLNDEDPLTMLDTIVQGTRRTLDFAIHCGAKKFLLTSSGAVYGKQPSELTHISEEYNGAPDTMNPQSAYGEAKRLAELLCSTYSRQYGVEAKIARCFAFVGPHLPLDSHFAIGNFILNAIKGEDIVVKGDGTPYRSYLYASDLMIWLWTILIKGENNKPYNVGSEEDITIEELAKHVSSCIDKQNHVEIAHQKSSSMPARYVPSINRAKEELGLSINVSLKDAINKTIEFYL